MPFLAPAFLRSDLHQYLCLLYLLCPVSPVFPLALGLLQYLHHRSNLPCHLMLRYLQHYNLLCHLMLFRILPLLEVLLLRCRRSRSINQSNSQDFSVPGLDFFQILLLQKTCPSIQVMRSLPLLSIVNVTLDSGDLICDDSTGSLRPLVPEVLCKPLFLALHNVSLILESEVHIGSSPPVLSGLDCLVMSGCGLDPVSGVNRARFRLM